ncbi:MAG: DUF3572 domain-containing protein [Paracoccaceae bacterium]|nr:DUF3572 domain-containing protein [Paracoccaceae bacterium]
MSWSAVEAETKAIRALEWMTADGAMLDRFLATTGARIPDIGNAIGNPEFLGSVLDFLMTQDSYVLRFCASEGLTHDDFAAIRAALPGGDLPHWT